MCATKRRPSTPSTRRDRLDDRARKALVVCLLNGEAEAEETFVMTDHDEESRVFAELYPSLRRFAAVVGPVDADPDDLLQEAVVRTLRHHHLHELEHPAAYLRRAIVHLASNERRRLAIRRQALTRFASGVPLSIDDYPSDLQDLSNIPPQERAVLYLSEVEGYRYGEIASALGCSEAAARKRAMRGRRRLAAALHEEVRHA
jgi:DNA-directed RNA polymerase specialized sigma24 family protein